jgi:ABC-type Mn2+/Zn2+ transport system ATPase subunit
MMIPWRKCKVLSAAYLDEPLKGVDAETRTVISDLLSELQRRGKTAVIATHELGRLEADFDGVVYLSEGREAPPPSGAFGGLREGREAVWVG